ncbi:MAG TPA: tRNA 2-thiouridine(34) synthase MnmA [Gemmatimonadaceae bacterium]|nr:tRNA 2-thiouridine(34) synthase MnmA [Gemmatimonadaceae bacterium]
MTAPARGRVVVAMSGGVDSSVAAAVLADAGYEVLGVTMKLFCYGDDVPDRPCCSLDSIDDARRVCERIGIPHYVLNLESSFGRDVVRDFVDEYARGRTPIPCVRCNTFTKFRDLVRKADALDADFIATGHYARADGRRLLRGCDPAKDQSYFLWGIDAAVIPRLLLPIGDLTKTETRDRARSLGLTHVAEKVESQDICFVPDGDHTRIIARTLGADTPALSAGPIISTDGRVLGEHQGYARYTIGQRRGLPGGHRDPLYVVAIRPADRAVVVGPREALLGRGIIAREINWLGEVPQLGHGVEVQVRHRAAPARAHLIRIDGSEIELALDEPVAAIAPGQSVVLYDGEHVLGGGVIESGRRTLPVRAA